MSRKTGKGVYPRTKLPYSDLYSYLRATSGLPPHIGGEGKIGCVCARGPGSGGGPPACLSIRTIATLCGVQERQLHRWKESGPTLRKAEDIADHLGVHVLEIWPGAYGRMVA